MNIPVSNITFFDNPRITAGFTYAGKDQVNIDGVIPGLNLGDNTPANREETDKNISLLLQSTGTDIKNLVLSDQVHGNRVKYVDNGGYNYGCDGFITSETGLMLGIKVADCAAILLADAENNVIGAVHAGWRGAVSGVIINTLKLMEEYGAIPSATKAYISPCISLQKFEVGDEVADQFPDLFVDRVNYSKPHVDLKGYIKHQLTEHRLSDENIRISDGCTVSNDHFYSYRREGDKAGRMLGFIKLT